MIAETKAFARMRNAQSASVGIVIVNWNGWRYTVEACRSLDRSEYRDFRIIIVDNASADDSLAQLRAALPDADIIANPTNAGFAGGCNVGIRHAMALGCDYVFLLNNDALVESQTISKLVEASKARNDLAVLGSVLVYVASGKYQFFGSRPGAVPDQSEWLLDPADRHLLQQDAIETDFILGAALFLPTKVLEKVGLFDERFFLNYEETDLCRRAHKLGFPAFMIPASVVRHHGSATMGAYRAPLQLYFLTRNALLFTQKHGSPQEFRTSLISRLAVFYWNVRRSWEAGVILDLPTRGMLQAFWDFYRHRFGDCPPSIRRLDASFRKQAHAPSSEHIAQKDAAQPSESAAEP